MRWQESWRDDPLARRLADRHYNRQSVGASGFVPPGACLVLRTPAADAFWITSWPRAEYVQHAWPGAWVCSAFRREPDNPDLASELIGEAVAATRHRWPDVPELGMITFVDERKVRRKRDPGRCFIRAGFEPVGRTRTRDFLALQLPAERMPEPVAALGTQGVLA